VKGGEREGRREGVRDVRRTKRCAEGNRRYRVGANTQEGREEEEGVGEGG